MLPRQKRSRDGRAARAALVLAGVGLAFLTIEVAMRGARLAVRPSPETAPMPAEAGGRRALIILCLGESTTAPTAGQDHSWPHQLQEMLAARFAQRRFIVVNKGVGGTNSKAVAAALPGYLSQYKPDLAIAMIGVNDSQWYGLAQEESSRLRTVKLLRYLYHYFVLRDAPAGPPSPDSPQRDAVVEELRSRGVPVILMQYPGFDAQVLSRRFAGREGIRVVSNREAFREALSRGRYEDYFVDRFAGHWGHCTYLGDSLIAENAAAAAAAALGLGSGRGPPESPLAAAERLLPGDAGALRLLKGLLARRPADLEALGLLAKDAPDRPALVLDYVGRAQRAARGGPAAGRARVFIECARLRLQFGDRAGAVGLLKETLDLEPGDSDALLKLGEALPDEPKTTLAYAERAVAASGGHPLTDWVADRECVLLRLRVGDAAGAREAFERGFERTRFNPGLLSVVPELYKDEPRLAFKFAETAVKAADDAPATVRAGSYREAARIHFRLGDAAGARQWLDRALEVMPADLDSLELASELDRGDPRAARQDAARAERAARDALDWQDPQACRQAAREMVRLGDAAGAERIAGLLLASPPDDLESLNLMVEIKRQTPTEALPYAERAVHAAERAGPNALLAALGQAAALNTQLGESRAAQRLWRRVLDARPGDLVALNSMVGLSKGDPARERRYADLAARAASRASASDQLAAYKQEAAVLLRLKDEAGAARAAELALRLKGDDPEALSLLAQAASADPARALRLSDAAARAAVKAAPAEAAAAYVRAAAVHLRLKDRRGAESLLKQALESQPEDGAARLALAELYWDRPRDGVDLLRADLPAQPKSRAYWLTLRALLGAAAGDNAGFGRDLREALELSAQTACLEAPPVPDRSRIADSYFDLCLARLPASATLYLDRGVARYNRGLKAEAAADLRKALELDPVFAPAYLSLATIEAEGPDPREALEIAQTGLLRVRKGDPLRGQLSALRDSLRARREAKD